MTVKTNAQSEINFGHAPKIKQISKTIYFVLLIIIFLNQRISLMTGKSNTLSPYKIQKFILNLDFSLLRRLNLVQLSVTTSELL